MAGEASVADAAAMIEEDFEFLDGPREKIEHVVELGKELPPLEERHKLPENLVRGCQSQVWLVADLDESGRLRLSADSDAIIVKGLISLVLRLYDGRTPQEVLDNPPEVFERVGLGSMLTPGRSNGLYSLINKVQQLARGVGKAA